MFKNQLQELAQRSCFNLPSYACIREGPDHAPRFKASVNFNGEIFESPTYCSTLRQAEHAAAEVALNALSTRGPSRSLTARVLDETGVYKNLLQETARRAGLNLPVYTIVRSGPGHVPVFTSTVELAGMNFTGEPAKTKKQAEKNAAIAAWSALKRMPYLGLLSQTSKDTDNREDQEQVIVARFLSSIGPKDETRTIKRMVQNHHSRRRMQRNHRDNGSNDCVEQKQRWFMDLFADSSSSASSIKKSNSFVSLLPPPPPPPRTSSRILPPTSSRDSPSLYQSAARPTPLQVMDNSQGKGKEIAPPLSEHQRDEDQWLDEKSEAIQKTIEMEELRRSISSVLYAANPAYRLFEQSSTGKLKTALPDRTQENAQTQIRSGLLGPKTASQMALPELKASSCNHMVRSTFTSGYHPRKIAPAVQVRSVIPVCAAPPPPIRPYSSNPPPMQEVASPSAPTQTRVEVLPASTKLNSPQLQSTFSKLQL